MPLIRLRDLHLAFGGPQLLSGASLTLDKGERICLVGRNGTGKSTLLKIISGQIKPDDGVVEVQPGIRIAWLEQEVPQDARGTVFDVVASGLGRVGEYIQRYHHLLDDVAHGDEKAFAELEQVQKQLEAHDGWQMEQRVETALSKLDLRGDVEFLAQSGGVKRRVLLARALVQEPDILLLDEPTNHLDIESIQWLEEFLLQYRNCVLFITHDREFLRKLATRIVDLDRGKLSDWPGDYDNYLRRKEEVLHAEALEWERFDKKLAQEEVWIRQGIKARRTRNEGRVRALEAMRNERSQRRERQGNVKASIQQAESSGQKVIEAEHISVAFNGRPIFTDFSTVILRGDRIGIIGPNGVGKSTLIQTLLGQRKPDSGKVTVGTNVEVAYFDQLRAQLDENMNVRDNVGGGRDSVTINGQQRHIMGYLQDFLFSPDRAHTPIRQLSGGERNRLLLAKLFTKPSNLLVLDEPTNDLDIETLELLEEMVSQYQGTILLVSHDRQFLNNIVTSTFVFEGNGVINEYVGGYDDWLRQRRPVASPQPAKETSSLQGKSKNEAPAPAPASTPASAAKPRKKLSYKEQRELETLPQTIEKFEQEIAALTAQLSDPNLYQPGNSKAADLQFRLAAAEQALEVAFARWAELDSQ